MATETSGSWTAAGKKWIAEGRDLITEVPRVTPTTYTAHAPDHSIRAFLPEVLQASAARTAQLVDVRSPQEYRGDLLALPGLPETCQRSSHIPGANNIPWGKTCQEAGTFKNKEELRVLYETAGIAEGSPRSPTAALGSGRAACGAC